MNFYVTLRTTDGFEPLLDPQPFPSLEAAYLDACAAIPHAAADLIRARRNPFRCAFVISSEAGLPLMEVPFTDALLPSERDGQERPGPAGGASPAGRLQSEIGRSRRLFRTSADLHRRAAVSISASRALLSERRLSPTIGR